MCKCTCMSVGCRRARRTTRRNKDEPTEINLEKGHLTLDSHDEVELSRMTAHSCARSSSIHLRMQFSQIILVRMNALVEVGEGRLALAQHRVTGTRAPVALQRQRRRGQHRRVEGGTGTGGASHRNFQLKNRRSKKKGSAFMDKSKYIGAAKSAHTLIVPDSMRQNSLSFA